VGSLAAIVIAGGEGRRFGGDKLSLRDASGRELLEVVVAGIASQADPIIIVGPERSWPAAVQWTREDPPGGGPCAALIAGLALLPDDATHVAVLAGDSPAGGAAVSALRTVIDDAAVAVVTDGSGREQPMTAVYAVAPLREALSAYGDGAHRSLREVLDDLRPRTVVSIIDAWSASQDVDVRADADRLGFS
jgi:molybdopterin-guanine dinucleotide biosynthesis protein A